jgi:hypothetical protein
MKGIIVVLLVSTMLGISNNVDLISHGFESFPDLTYGHQEQKVFLELIRNTEKEESQSSGFVGRL